MEISVLQWNIWYREDIRKIAEFLKQNPADIICLQELIIGSPDQSVEHTTQFIADQLGLSYYAKELPIESTDGQKILLANGIFSRFPITSSRDVWINQPEAGGGYDDEYRAYVEIELNINSRLFYVGTTHMTYTHRFQLTERKKHETDLLVKELRKHTDNFVFTGDLNATPDSYTVNSIREGLQDTGPESARKTWTTKPFSYNGFEEADLNWRLDYVFATPDLQVRSSEILPTDYSDHLPILTEFNLS